MWFAISCLLPALIVGAVVESVQSTGWVTFAAFAGTLAIAAALLGVAWLLWPKYFD
jgi:hypothetical protein